MEGRKKKTYTRYEILCYLKKIRLSMHHRSFSSTFLPLQLPLRLKYNGTSQKCSKFQLKTCFYNKFKIASLSTTRYRNKNSDVIIRKLRAEKIPMVSEQPAVYQLTHTNAGSIHSHTLIIFYNLYYYTW